MNGQGTYTFADGSEYVGKVRDGDYHGQGTFTNADGFKYVCEYRDGKPHGQGTSTYARGTNMSVNTGITNSMDRAHTPGQMEALRKASSRTMSFNSQGKTQR